MKLITKLISLILTLGCIFNVGYIINNNVNPELPVLSVYEKNLQDVEFPLSCLICIDQLVNDTTKYREVGYSNVYRFYIGESMHNESVIGWRGHMRNGSIYKSVEGFCII